MSFIFFKVELDFYPAFKGRLTGKAACLWFQLSQSGSCQITRNAAHAKTIRTVRRDGDFYYRVIEALDIDEFAAERFGGTFIQLDDAFMIV